MARCAFRNFLRLAFGASAALVAGSSAEAEVFFDTERYGDKELKVALINQVKQQFRGKYTPQSRVVAATRCLLVRSLIYSLLCISFSSIINSQRLSMACLIPGYVTTYFSPVAETFPHFSLEKSTT